MFRGVRATDDGDRPAFLDPDRQDASERSRRLLERSPGAIFVYDLDGELRWANEAAVAFLGADEEAAVVGSRAGAFTHPDDRALVEERYRRLVEDGEAVPPVEETIVGLDGERKQALVASAPTSMDGQRVIQTVATDVTDQKRRERELRRQNEHLEELASVLGHDLRNPLEIASGNLELVRDERDCERLETVADALDRIDETIDDTLSLVEAGRRVRATEVVDLAGVVESHWSTVATADADLIVEDEVALRADPSRLDHLVGNLLRNAIEHGGEDATVRVGAVDGGFYVADDGPGIPTGERDAVFEVGHSSEPAGTGFGLAIVAKAADVHGWSVTVAESDAGGARFEFTGVERAPLE